MAFLIMIFSLLTHPAKAQQVKVMNALSVCQGFLARMNPTSETVYLFSAGHCVPGIKSFDDPHHIVIKKDLPKPKEFSVYGFGKIITDQIIYGAYQPLDFAILRIHETASDLIKKGITPYVVTSARYPAPTLVTVYNLHVGESTSCNVEGYPYLLTYQEYTWTLPGRLGPECKITHGWSGSAVINNVNHEILGLISGGNETGDCTDFCEVTEDGKTSAYLNQTYFSRLDVLHACTNSAGVIIPENCRLK